MPNTQQTSDKTLQAATAFLQTLQQMVQDAVSQAQGRAPADRQGDIKIYTLAEVAELLHCGKQVVTELAQTGRLECFTPDHGKHKYLFTAEAVQAYIRKCSRGGQDTA